MHTVESLWTEALCYHEVLFLMQTLARIERDQEAMKGLERSEYAEDHLMFEHLERYDMGEEYTLRE